MILLVEMVKMWSQGNVVRSQLHEGAWIRVCVPEGDQPITIALQNGIRTIMSSVSMGPILANAYKRSVHFSMYTQPEGNASCMSETSRVTQSD